MQYCIQAEETGGQVTPLFTVPEFRQRLLRFDGGGDERRDDERDEVLVRARRDARTATVGGEDAGARCPGRASSSRTARLAGRRRRENLKLLSVLVEEPLPASASHAVIASGERGAATAGREFTLLAHPDNGCESVTQFVGYIPAGRAPDHFHLYDEVVYILAGEGAFHVGGESAPLRAGSCFHLPARLVHCVENHGPGEMQVLGVFRPAGSPAEAYYPDGAAAAVPRARNHF